MFQEKEKKKDGIPLTYTVDESLSYVSTLFPFYPSQEFFSQEFVLGIPFKSCPHIAKTFVLEGLESRWVDSFTHLEI